jgi:hypothetical protein
VDGFQTSTLSEVPSWFQVMRYVVVSDRGFVTSGSAAHKVQDDNNLQSALLQLLCYIV